MRRVPPRPHTKQSVELWWLAVPWRKDVSKMKVSPYRFCVAPMMIGPTVIVGPSIASSHAARGSTPRWSRPPRSCMVTRHVCSISIRSEYPLAVQLGGSDPDDLARCSRICEAWGYDEININIGCPSDRVQNGAFGACLMREPALVGRCVAAMKATVRVPVTVKCRLGVDEQEPRDALDAMAQSVIDAGADALVVHARKAWLKGLSPRENRDVPPLDYPLVYDLKRRFPGVPIVLNGGLADWRPSRRRLGRPTA